MNKVLTKMQEKTKRDSTNVEHESTFDDSFVYNITENDERRLPRSPLYMETISAADLLSKDDKIAISRIRKVIGEDVTEELESMSSSELEKEIEDVINEELPNKSSLIGVVCRCYIEGCDCHEITPAGKIKEHFTIGQEVPSKICACREYLKNHDNCAFIEIYEDCTIAIDNDSTAKILK